MLLAQLAHNLVIWSRNRLAQLAPHYRQFGIQRAVRDLFSINEQVILITIRPETPADLASIHHVNEAAFGRPAEADLVDTLRQHGAITLSWVAAEADQIVGHVLYTPATVSFDETTIDAVALGPVAVLLAYQNQGIGSRLIRESLEALRTQGHSLVFVLGHHTYYPRFGFKPSTPLGIECEFKVPEEAFMVLELRPSALNGMHGVMHYQPEFSDV